MTHISPLIMMAYSYSYISYRSLGAPHGSGTMGDMGAGRNVGEPA